MAKIFPRNLPAQRYARVVAGNPVTTRLESGVSNCYPGLEYDHRNLDRRFFPGLIFNFASGDANGTITQHTGAHLAGVDLSDPALVAEDPSVSAALAAAQGDLAAGSWFLASIAQDGKTISCLDGNKAPLDGAVVWNIVHGLVRDDAKLVTIVIAYRGTPPAPNGTPGATSYTFTARRRAYVDEHSGEFAVGFGAGELTQSLCSPWQHDFRDCGCDYWSSNHPDIVLAPNDAGAPSLPNGAPADPDRAALLVDWLRYDRSTSGLARAPGTRAGVRPYQIDHYWINQNWQTLNFVLRGREVGAIFRTPEADSATPYGNADDLAAGLVTAAGIEHLELLMVLYARYSVKSDDELAADKAEQTLRDIAAFTKHELLMLAVSQMRHLRWVNQLLWEIASTPGLLKVPIVLPALQVATEIPLGTDVKGKPLPPFERALRPFDAATVTVFTQAKAPGGAVDGLYARAVTTLRGGEYPAGSRELAAQVAADNVAHFSRFEELQGMLQFAYDEAAASGKPVAFLRAVTPAAPTDPKVAGPLNEYKAVLVSLGAAYKSFDPAGLKRIGPARQLMDVLDGQADTLAQGGVGLPFFTAQS